MTEWWQGLKERSTGQKKFDKQKRLIRVNYLLLFTKKLNEGVKRSWFINTVKNYDLAANEKWIIKLTILKNSKRKSLNDFDKFISHMRKYHIFNSSITKNGCSPTNRPDNSIGCTMLSESEYARQIYAKWKSIRRICYLQMSHLTLINGFI